MHITVCLKYVTDPSTIEVDPITGAIDEVRTLYITNLADETALEMALRLCPESGTVKTLTVGDKAAERVLRDALAVGADSACRLWDDAFTETHPAMTARLMAAAMRTSQRLPDLILCGARSVDRSTGKVPALLGENLDWPVITDVTAVEIQGDCAHVQRRLARGARAESEVRLPAVLGLEPSIHLRQASLPGSMAAKRAEIPVRQLVDLGLSLQDLDFPRATLYGVMPPRPRPREIFIPDSHLAPEERISQIMSAGVTGKSGQVLEGPPEAMADAIITFLEERGFLDHLS